jgi:hypothetical protein
MEQSNTLKNTNNTMLTYVIIISEKFPAYHPKAGQPTDYPRAIKHYDKIHTIRGNYALWEKRFKKIEQGIAQLSLRIWEGRPRQSNQLEIFRYDRTHKIGIEKLVIQPDCFQGEPLPAISEQFFHPRILRKIAKNDGLTYDDFQAWFKPYNKREEMAIIHFTHFRYAAKPV